MRIKKKISVLIHREAVSSLSTLLMVCDSFRIMLRLQSADPYILSLVKDTEYFISCGLALRQDMYKWLDFIV